MHFILLFLIGFHLWCNRRTKTLLLPSHLLCLLDIFLQMLVPILIIQKTRHQDTYPLALLIVTAGVASFVFSYRIARFLPLKTQALNGKMGAYLSSFDTSLKKGNLLIFWLGLLMVSFVFFQMRLIPAFGNTELGDPRFFYWNPTYYAIYKYPYWLGISMLSAATLNSFIFMQKEEKKTLGTFLVFLVSILILILTRHRGPIFALGMAMYTFYYQLHPKRLNPIHAILHVTSAFFLAMLFLFLREGSGELTDWIFTALKHGSSFVDFHEFVSSIQLFGDRSFLMGKTYIADLLGFLPLGTMEFRDHYRWKEWTKILFDIPPTAGGYRLTLFGESYFNFGFIGVIIQGFLLGIGYRYLDDIILGLQKYYQKNKTFSLSSYFLISSTATCAVSAIGNFYNILFSFAIIGGCIAVFLASLIFRDLFTRKYASYSYDDTKGISHL